MDEEFYAVIKLVSGEEILSLVLVDDSTDDTLLVLQNPIIIKMMNSATGIYLKVKPWMELVEDDIYFIKLDKVLTCLLYTSPSPRDKRQSRMPSSA